MENVLSLSTKIAKTVIDIN